MGVFEQWDRVRFDWFYSGNCAYHRDEKTVGWQIAPCPKKVERMSSGRHKPGSIVDVRNHVGRALLLLIAVTSCLYFASCTTPYKPYGLMGGFSDNWIGPRMHAVGFDGNGFTSLHQVRTYTLFRCSELTLEQGYTHFVILQGSSGSSTSVGVVPPTQYSYGYAFPVTAFSNLVYIRLMCPAEASTINAYDARSTFLSMRPSVSPGRSLPRPISSDECTAEINSAASQRYSTAEQPQQAYPTPPGCNSGCRSIAEFCARSCISSNSGHFDVMVAACQGQCRVWLQQCRAACSSSDVPVDETTASGQTVEDPSISPQSRPLKLSPTGGQGLVSETGIVVAASDEVIVVETLCGKQIFKAQRLCVPEFIEGEVVKSKQSPAACATNELTSTTAKTTCAVWCE